MPGLLQLMGKIAHGAKKGEYFLHMVHYVLLFLHYLEHDVGNVAVGAFKPTVINI